MDDREQRREHPTLRRATLRARLPRGGYGVTRGGYAQSLRSLSLRRSISIANPEGAGKTKFKVKKSMLWSKVFDSWGAKHGADASAFKFALAGANISRLASVSSTEVQDGDVVEAFILQTGGR